MLFSFVIPTYNRASFILGAIKSILSIPNNNYEIIVVDDGSTDDTESVVKSIKDDRIRYYKIENSERAAARNYGTLRAKGDYITFLDSDDVVMPHYLEEAQLIIDLYNSPEFFHLAYQIQNEQGKVIKKFDQRKGSLNKKLLKGNFLSCIGIFIQRDIAVQNLFNERRILSASEDWELWVRLAARYPIYYSNRISAALVQHNQRSVLKQKTNEELENRIYFAFQSIFEDKVVMNTFGKFKNIIFAHLNLYLSLHYLIDGSKRKSIIFLAKAFKTDMTVLFSKKVLILVFKLIFR
jgi:glycosyltransferase involved in cell wall biosynthesis